MSTVKEPTRRTGMTLAEFQAWLLHRARQEGDSSRAWKKDADEAGIPEGGGRQQEHWRSGASYSFIEVAEKLAERTP